MSEAERASRTAATVWLSHFTEFNIWQIIQDLAWFLPYAHAATQVARVVIGDNLTRGVQPGDVGLDNVNDEIAPVDDLGSDALGIFIEIGVLEEFWIMLLEGEGAGPADEDAFFIFNVLKI